MGSGVRAWSRTGVVATETEEDSATEFEILELIEGMMMDVEIDTTIEKEEMEGMGVGEERAGKEETSVDTSWDGVNKLVSGTIRVVGVVGAKPGSVGLGARVGLGGNTGSGEKSGTWSTAGVVAKGESAISRNWLWGQRKKLRSLSLSYKGGPKEEWRMPML